ncbi:MAG: nuclear transport factor 2 family protein [Solirubrobacteraceae bacterium]
MSAIADPHPFRLAVEAKDAAAMEAALHPDVVFRSPVVHRPYAGREATMLLLRNVVEVFEDFRYVDELRGERTLGLVFEARVGDRELQGWDYLTLDDAGLVTSFTVMVRPLSGANALAQAMAARLEVSEPKPAGAP